jgi:hypothetical protein
VWLDVNGPEPSADYVNKFEMLKKLNASIKDYNNEIFTKQESLYQNMLGDDWCVPGSKSPYPSFHTYGIRSFRIKKAGKMVNRSKHRWSCWRETAAVLAKSEGMTEEEKKEAVHKAAVDGLHL